MNTVVKPKDVEFPPKNIPLQSLGQKYQIISNLGNGSFGSVSLAKFRGNSSVFMEHSSHKSGTLMEPIVDCQINKNSLVAIKTMNKRLPFLKDYTTVKEVLFILAIPAHPNLIQVYEIFIDDTAFQLHIAMECMNQNLYQLMKARKNIHFSPTTLRSIISQILNGIRHIHRHSYFHRDIKPENILVIPTNSYYGEKSLIPFHRRNDNYTIKIADYGLARHIDNTKSYTAYVSTRWYRSPEILLRRKHYSRPVDIWAFGTVAVEIATFRPLFPGSNELDQTWRILETLGSPSLVDTSSYPANSVNEIPLGGFWEDAQILSSRLGFHLPYTQGVKINQLLPKPEHSLLCDVVKACLSWDPELRADAEYLCTMPYFKDTVVAQPYTEPRKLHVPPNESKPSSKDHQNVSRLFAGISTNQQATGNTAAFDLNVPVSTFLSEHRNNVDNHVYHSQNNFTNLRVPDKIGSGVSCIKEKVPSKSSNLQLKNNAMMIDETNFESYNVNQSMFNDSNNIDPMDMYSNSMNNIIANNNNSITPTLVNNNITTNINIDSDNANNNGDHGSIHHNSNVINKQIHSHNLNIGHNSIQNPHHHLHNSKITNHGYQRIVNDEIQNMNNNLKNEPKIQFNDLSTSNYQSSNASFRNLIKPHQIKHHGSPNDENLDQNTFTHSDIKLSNEARNTHLLDSYMSNNKGVPEVTQMPNNGTFLDKGQSKFLNCNSNYVTKEGHVKYNVYDQNEVNRSDFGAMDAFNMYDLLTDYQMENHYMDNEVAYDMSHHSNSSLKLENTPPELASGQYGSNDELESSFDSPQTNNVHNQNPRLHLKKFEVNDMICTNEEKDVNEEQSPFVHSFVTGESNFTVKVQESNPTYIWNSTDNNHGESVDQESSGNNKVRDKYSYDLLRSNRDIESVLVDDSFSHDVSFNSTEGIKC